MDPQHQEQATVKKRLAVTTTLAVVFVALGGCGGDGGGSTGPVFSDSVSSTEAAGFALGAQWLTGTILDRMNGSRPDITPALVQATFRGRALPELLTGPHGPLAPQFAAPPTGCTITAHGTLGNPDDFVDHNGNGVPDDLYVKEECILADSLSDTTVTDHVVRIVEVKEIAGSQFGYTRTIGYAFARIDKNGKELNGFSYDETEGLDQRPARVTHTGKTDYREWEMVDGAKVESTGGFDFSATFTPTGAGSVVMAPPDSLPDGKLTITGHNYQTSADGRNLWFGLSTPVPLVYSRSCAVDHPGITFGSMTGALNSDATQATFTTSYDGCDGYSTNYTGTKD